MGKWWVAASLILYTSSLMIGQPVSDSITSGFSPRRSELRTGVGEDRNGNDSLARYLQFDDPSPLSCLLTLLPPVFIQHDLELKSFIRSATFRRIRDRYGDPCAANAIYVRAMQLTNNNTAIALLLSAFASFDHQVIGLKVPVFALFFPLTNESDQEFDHRVRNLPTELYPDTPPAGDRDKLQHFFGSAFLSFVLESAPPADRFGEFVEQEEGQWIVGGANDDRDRRSNRQGQHFGLSLLDNNRRYPSDFMQLRLAKSKKPSMNDTHCEGIW